LTLPLLNIYSGFHECYKCGNEIEVIALKETRDVKHLLSAMFDEERFIEKISYVEPLLLQSLQNKFPNFKFVYSRTAEDKYYGNTCQYCGALYGNYHLFYEPDGAFFSGPGEYMPSYYLVELANGGFSIVEYEEQIELNSEDNEHIPLTNKRPTNLFDFE